MKHINNLHQFLLGFAQATGLDRDTADKQWAAFSRQLSNTERERIESRGYDAGLEEGRGFKHLFPWKAGN